MVIDVEEGPLYSQTLKRCFYYLRFSEEVKKADCNLCPGEHRGTS